MAEEVYLCVPRGVKEARFKEMQMWVAAKNTDFAVSLLAAYVVYPTQLSMTRNPNPRWIVNCRNCLASFTHSEVGKDRKLNDYLFPTAPEFSSAGEEMECPSCKTKAIYAREDLQYRSE